MLGVRVPPSRPVEIQTTVYIMADVIHLIKEKPEDYDLTSERTAWKPWEAIIVDGTVMMQGENLNLTESLRQLGGRTVENVGKARVGWSDDVDAAVTGFPGSLNAIRNSDKWILRD